MDLIAKIRNRMTGPRGPLPESAPKALLLGISAAVIIPMMFCGRNPQHQTGEHLPAIPTTTTVPAETVAAIRARLDQTIELLRRKELEQKQVRQPAPPIQEPEPPPRIYTSPTRFAPPPVEVKQAGQDDRKASNIVFSYRTPQPGLSGPPTTSEKSLEKVVVAGSPKPTAPVYRIREGIMIETVLANRLDGTFTGPVNCLVTTPVYSEDRQTLLIPPGTHVLGHAEKVEKQGQERLAVVFHRLILPDGSSFSLNKVPGLNGVGEAGLDGRVNHHYGRLLGTSAALGILGGAALGRTVYPNVSGIDLYAQGVASSSANSATQILNRQLDILPQVTIFEGHRVQVYLTQDIHLPAYGGALSKEQNEPAQD